MVVPYSASDCKTPEELDAWKQRQLDMVDNFIPDAWQKNVKDNVEEDFKKNQQRLAGAVPDADADTPVDDKSAPQASNDQRRVERGL
ncbi:unnamed protein product [Effrenium voratum]|uniref:Uncharacterized protein n=1 Tax=Effrenium voratum TaxID=2562239 RepID=A0AA36ICI4_9DINO|nr:unnamed protein product [Effrenium voratum]